MATAKIALSIPEDVLEAVDAAARERSESRSGFVTRVLRAATRARSDAEVTRRLEEIFADPAIASEQLRVAESWIRRGRTGPTKPGNEARGGLLASVRR